MIFNFIISAVTFLFNAFVSLLPDANSAYVKIIFDTSGEFADLIAPAAWVFPVDQFMLVLTATFAIHFSFFFYNVTKWIVSLLTMGLIRR